MKTYGTTLVLVMASVLLFTALPCGAAEKDDENFWLDDKPKQDHRRFELTDERIERIMGRLAENDPEKAEELEQLRQKDPEKFKAELRETMREKFGKRFRQDNMRERSGRMSKGHNMQKRSGRMSRGHNMQKRSGKRFEGHKRPELTDERIERIMARLAGNDPEKAKELEQLRQKDPEKFKAELRETMREKFDKMSRGRNMREQSGRMSKGHNMQKRSGRMSRGHNMQKRSGKRFEGHKRPELTDERIERIMARLAENDPEKAEELEQLRQKDPEKFKAELKETMREHFGKRFREHKGYKQKKN